MWPASLAGACICLSHPAHRSSLQSGQRTVAGSSSHTLHMEAGAADGGGETIAVVVGFALVGDGAATTAGAIVASFNGGTTTAGTTAGSTVAGFAAAGAGTTIGGLAAVTGARTAAGGFVTTAATAGVGVTIAGLIDTTAIGATIAIGFTGAGVGAGTADIGMR